MRMIGEPEIRKVVGSILTKGLLRIREQAALGRVRFCEIEANHLHNLPQILLGVRQPLLDYYYKIERLDYLNEYKEIQGEVGPVSAEDYYAEEWKLIGDYLESISKSH